MTLAIIKTLLLLYLVGPRGVLPSEAHYDQGQHGGSVEDPRREAEEINQAFYVAGNDHGQRHDALSAR